MQESDLAAKIYHKNLSWTLQWFNIDYSNIQYLSLEVSCFIFSCFTTNISAKSGCFARILSLDAVVVCGANTEDL